MKIVKSVLSVLMGIIILSLDMLWFIETFSVIINPGGLTGEVSTYNIIASCINLFFFMIFPLGIMFSFFVGTMFQGLSFGVSGLEEIGFRFAFIMPFIVIAFYILGKKLAKPKN